MGTRLVIYSIRSILASGDRSPSKGRVDQRQVRLRRVVLERGERVQVVIHVGWIVVGGWIIERVQAVGVQARMS
jgi:hypothetical protein